MSSGRGKGRNERHGREAAARAKRTANAKPSAALPVTEASQLLAADLEAAGQHALADRARNLQFDENYSRDPFPLMTLVQILMLADLTDLVQAVKDGRYDATQADNAAWYLTPKGAAEKREMDGILDELPADVRATMDANMKTLADHPEYADRLADQALGKMAMDLGIDEPAPDDDRILTPADVRPQLHTLLGSRSANGTRLDTPEIMAAAELACGMKSASFEVGWVPPDHAPKAWYAECAPLGPAGKPIRIRTPDLPGPNAAARELAKLLLEGGQCLGCGKVVSLDPRGFYTSDRTLADGRVWTQAEQAKAGSCLWRRRGVHWYKGCVPLPAEAHA